MRILEEAPLEKSVTYDSEVASTEIDSFQNEIMESNAIGG